MRELKRQLRRELIEKRRGMSAAVKSAADRDIFEQLKPLMESASAVFIYVSTEIEVDTTAAIGWCFEQGIPVAVPVSGECELSFFRIRSFEELAPGRYNILEPVNRTEEMTADKNALCVVPALCADGEGLRLGYGKGYYDRFLSRFSGRSVILCYADFKRAVPAEQHDRKADMTIFDRK